MVAVVVVAAIVGGTVVVVVVDGGGVVVVVVVVDGSLIRLMKGVVCIRPEMAVSIGFALVPGEFGAVDEPLASRYIDETDIRVLKWGGL